MPNYLYLKQISPISQMCRILHSKKIAGEILVKNRNFIYNSIDLFYCFFLPMWISRIAVCSLCSIIPDDGIVFCPYAEPSHLNLLETSYL